MSEQVVKRYDPINSDGTCGMCIEDADYGAYVEYADYAALEAELATVKKVAYGNMELLDENRNLQAELAKLRAELERRAVDGWKLAVDNVAGYAHLYNSGSGIIHEIRAEHARLLAAAPAAPAADAVITASEWTKDADEWGGALNYAAWEFTNECPEKSALLFNNTKGPLRAAIMKYAELVAAHRAKGVV